MVTVLENNFKRRERCTHCKSLLEFGYKDIITVSERHPGGKTEKYIICPCCEHKIYLKSKYDKPNNDNKLYSTCPKCGENKLTRLHIEDSEIYSCLNCWYKIDYFGEEK